MSFATYRKYQDSRIDRALTFMGLTPMQRTLDRIMRAANSDEVDLFSEEGILDPSLIPLLGAFFTHENDVTGRERVQIWNNALGADMEEDSLATQIALGIFTDPMAWATLGVGTTGRAGKEVATMQKLLSKGGSKIGQEAKTADDLLKAVDDYKNVRGLRLYADDRVRLGQAAQKIKALKKAELAKKNGVDIGSLTLNELQEHSIASINRWAVPFTFNRLGVNTPFMRGSASQWMRKPITGTLGASLQLGSKTTGGLRLAAEALSGPAMPALVQVLSTPVTKGAQVLDTLMKTPGDFIQGSRNYANNVRDTVGPAMEYLRHTLNWTKVQYMGRTDFFKEVEDALLGTEEFASSADSIVRALNSSIPDVNGSWASEGFTDVLEGRRPVEAVTELVLPDYLKKEGILKGKGFDKAWRKQAFDWGARTSAEIRKTFQGKTDSKTFNEALAKSLAVRGAQSRWIHDKAEVIGEQVEQLRDLHGLENTDAVLNYFDGFMSVIPQLNDELIFTGDIIAGGVGALAKRSEALNDYAGLLNRMELLLGGGASGTPGAVTDLPSYRKLFPKAAAGKGPDTLPLRELSQKYIEEGQVALDLKQEYDNLVEVLGKTKDWRTVTELQKKIGEVQEAIDAQRLQIEATSVEAQKMLNAFRGDLIARAKASFKTENSWVVKGIDKTFRTKDEAEAAAKAAGIKLRDKKGRFRSVITTEGEDIAGSLIDDVLLIGRDNTELASKMGMVSEDLVPTQLAYVPLSLTPRAETALQNFFEGSFKEFDDEVRNTIASAGARFKANKGFTNAELRDLQDYLMTRGHKGLGDDLQKIIDDNADAIYADPFSAVLTRSSQYKYYHDTGSMIDDLVAKGGEDYVNQMGGHIPTGMATPMIGGRLVAIEEVEGSRVEFMRRYGSTPAERAKFGGKRQKRTTGPRYEFIVELDNGKRIRVDPGILEEGFSMELRAVGNKVAGAGFVNQSDTLGKSYMAALAGGAREATKKLRSTVDPTDRDANATLKALQKQIAGDGENPYILLGQRKTLDALEEAAERESKAALALPAFLDGAHRALKMGVTTGNASFHMVTLGSALPMAIANGMSMGAFMKGVTSAAAQIWRSPRMDQAARRAHLLYGHAATRGQETGFPAFLSGLGQVGKAAIGAGPQGLTKKGVVTSPAVLVGAGYGMDKLTEGTIADPESDYAYRSLGGALAAIQFFRRGSGQAIIKSATLSTMDPRAYGDEWSDDLVKFVGMDGVEYTFRDQMRIAAEHGLFNTFVGEGTQNLTRTSKTLQDLIKNEKSKSSEIMDALGAAGQQSEIAARLAIFNGFMHMGLDPAAAARKTIDTMFDYNDLTPREQQVFKRFSSFYTFGKKILGQSVKRYNEDPAFFAKVAHLAYNKQDQAAKMFGEEASLDTSTGRAQFMWGDKQVDLNRLIPQLDLFHGVAWGHELFEYFGSSVLNDGPDLGSDLPHYGEAALEALRMGESTLSPQMGLASPGIFSGNVLYQPIFEGRQEGFAGAVKATAWHLVENMMIGKNIFGLRPSGSPSETSDTPYDDFVEGFLNTLGVKGEQNIERRRLFFEARHTRAMRQLNQMLGNKALPMHVRMEIKELMDEVQANYNATPLGRRAPTAETMFPGQGTF